MGIFHNGRLSVEDLNALGKEFGLSKPFIRDTIDRTKEAILKFPVHAKDFGISKLEIERVSKSLLR